MASDTLHLSEIQGKRRKFDGVAFVGRLGRHLKNYTFANCDFSETLWHILSDVYECKFVNCRFNDVGLNSDFRGSQFMGCRFNDCSVGGRFELTKWRSSELFNCTLTRCTFDGAEFGYGVFHYCTALYCDFDRTKFSNCDFSCSQVIRSTFQEAKFFRTVFPEAIFALCKEGPRMFEGGVHPIVVVHDRVQIGCMNYPIKWWLKNYDVVGRRQGYSASQIQEYHDLLKVIATQIKALTQDDCS